MQPRLAQGARRRAARAWRGRLPDAPAQAAPTPSPALATSIPPPLAPPAGQHRALAYLKCRREGKQVDLEGVAVVVDGSRGVVVAPPFLSRAFPDGPEGAVAAAVTGGGGGADAAAAAEAQRRKEEEEAAAAAARAEKLRAMQQRLAEFQQQQEAAGGQQ